MSGRFLLDTHVLLWVLKDDPHLGESARSRILGADVVLASAASLWELSIKFSVGKFPDPAPLLPAVEASGISLVGILPAHAFDVRVSPLAHRDPFDEMLLAQARAESALLVTADTRILGAGLTDVVDARS